MKTNTRRILLGIIGAALVVGGWGLTRYADEQQQVVSPGETTNDARIKVWADGWYWVRDSLLASRLIFGGGVLSMAIGAGLIGFALLRDRPDGTG